MWWQAPFNAVRFQQRDQARALQLQCGELIILHGPNSPTKLHMVDGLLAMGSWRSYQNTGINTQINCFFEHLLHNT